MSDMLAIYKQVIPFAEANFHPDKGTLNLSRLLQLILKTSGQHDIYLQKHGLNALISDEDTWVVTQYHMHFRDLSMTDEPITITTRVVSANSFTVSRYFECYQGKKLFATIHAQYVAINLASRQALRIDVNELKSMDIIDRSQAKRFKRMDFDLSVTPDYSVDYTIQQQDIDHNQHVNNTVYIQWCINTLPTDFIHLHQIQDIQVKYGQEILPHSTVMIETVIHDEDTDLRTDHIIRDNTKEAEACRIQIQWK